MQSLLFKLALPMLLLASSNTAVPDSPLTRLKPTAATVGEKPATVEKPQAENIPTELLELGGGEALIPDWHKISFATLPALAQSGSLNVLSWEVGQGIEQLLNLEDFGQTFELQNLSLFSIGLKTQIDPEKLSLSSFRLLKHQTIQSLVEAVPGLGDYPVAGVPPVAGLLRQIKPDYQLQELTPLSLVVEDPSLGRISFAEFDASPYQIQDIPGLTQAPLSAFDNWQKASINDIPGLRSMPWDEVVSPVENAALIGVVKILNPSQSVSSIPISGSNLDDYQASCSDSICPAIGFDENTVLANRQWISGQAQQVKGGGDALAQRNSGLEPTGRNLYGDAFKVVVTRIDADSIKTALYFRHCQRSSVLTPESCSPYGIGPIPFQTFQPGDPMFVGTVNPTPIDTSVIESAKTTSNPAIDSSSPSWSQWWSNLYNSLLAIFYRTLA